MSQKKICALKKKVRLEKNILRRKKICAPQKTRCRRKEVKRFMFIMIYLVLNKNESD